MIISYVGNRKNQASDGKSFNTENHIALTLEKLGHEVNFIQEDTIKNDLVERVSGSDLFLWTRTWKGFVTDQDLKDINSLGIKTVSFHLDKYAGIKRDGGIGEDTFWKTNYVFSPEGSIQSQKIFKDLGINQFYLPPAVYEDECYIAEPINKFKHDIVFVGGGMTYMHPEWGYRRKLVQWLNDTYGNRFVQYGGDKPTIRGAELNQLYSSSKIVIGDSLCKNFMDSYYYSDRCFEVTGRGGFMIAPYIAGITDHFVDRKEAVFYSFDNFTQLKNMIDYYLEHDDERETIRLAGHNRTKKYNTYTDRMKTMLDVIKSSGDGLITSSLDSTTPIKINFGSGNDPQYGHINVDMLKRDDVELVHNLMDFPYPFEDNSASHIRAVDVLEHLDHYTDGRRPTIVAFFEECYRILKTGGELYIQVPSWNTEIFEIDVTHVRGFHEKSFDFLDKTTWYGEIRDFYTNANFKITKRDKFDNGVMRFWLVKV